MTDVFDKAVARMSDVLYEQEATLDDTINCLMFLLSDALAQLTEYAIDEDVIKTAQEHLSDCVRTLCSDEPEETAANITLQ